MDSLKWYYYIIGIILLSVLYLGFIGPWLISSSNNIMVWLGIALFVFVYLPLMYVAFLGLQKKL